MKIIITLAIYLIAMACFSQTDLDTIKAIKLNEVELRSERYSKSNLKTSQKIESVK